MCNFGQRKGGFMKKKFLKLFTSVAMLALVFCLHQNVRAEEIAQPTEKDVYIHHDDGEDYVANRYERAIVVDRVPDATA